MPSIKSAIKEAVNVAVADVTAKLDRKEAELVELKRRVEDLEAYSRMDNIIVCGLPEAASEIASGVNYSADTVPTTGGEMSTTSELLFINFCREKLKIEVNPNDISVAHRLARPRGTVSGPHPMIIRFSNRKAKFRVLAARRALRGQPSCKNIYINEHLTIGVSQLFHKARKLVKDTRIQTAWTTGGKLYIKTLPKDGSRIQLISSDLDLASL